jgi:hypothetical protein
MFPATTGGEGMANEIWELEEREPTERELLYKKAHEGDD